MHFLGRTPMLGTLLVASAVFLLGQHNGNGSHGGAYGGGGGYSRTGPMLSGATPMISGTGPMLPGTPATRPPAPIFRDNFRGPGSYPSFTGNPTGSGHSGSHGSHGSPPYVWNRRYPDRGRGPSYFFAPYYYPLFGDGSSFYDDAGPYGYDAGPGQPPEDQPSPQTGALMDQVQRLSAQVSDLRDSLQAPPAQPGGPTQSDAEQPSQPPSPPITLVLTNGKSMQVQSYAVMDNTFWDLSGQITHKIPLSKIDIPASTKATEASGAEFPQLQAGK